MCVCVQTTYPVHDPYFDKGSQSLDCQPSPPPQRQLGSYSNLYEGSQPPQAGQGTAMGATLQAVGRAGPSGHALRGLDNHHHHHPPPVNIYQRAASASPQRPHVHRAPLSPGEDLSPRSPTAGGSLPTSPSGERFSSRDRSNRGPWEGGGGSLGRVVDGDKAKPQAIRVSSPYMVSPPAGGVRTGLPLSPMVGREGMSYGPASSSPATVVGDRVRTYHTSRSRSRESLDQSRENISRSRELLSRSRDGLSSEEVQGRSRETSVSSYRPAANTAGRLGSVGNHVGSPSARGPLQSPRPGDGVDGQIHPPSFVQALQLTEAAEVREREHFQSHRLRRARKESSKSVYDSVTSYEASV